MKTVKANVEPLPPEKITRRTCYLVMARSIDNEHWQVATGFALWLNRELAENAARNLDSRWVDPIIVEIPGEEP